MSKSKKKREITTLKSDEKSSFFTKKKTKMMLPMGKKHVFFSRISTKFQGQKSKFRLFSVFLTPNSNYMVQNLTLKMTKKITFERNLTVEKWGGGGFYSRSNWT